VSRSASDILARRPAQKVKAVDGVDLAIGRGFTLGLVGESGSGKTSLARAVIGLEKATGGKMELLGLSLPSGISKRTLEMMRHLQIVFQNPEEALNPYRTVGETLRRPLMKLSLTSGQASTGQALSRKEADEAVTSLLADVRLPAEYAQRRPGQLSGGEKQRVAIARAFAANPDLLISDEPVSALDVSVQASILNLLHDLQAERGTSNLFISHNLAVVGYLADQIAVIYAGSLMELAGAEDLFKPPYHPYTEALLGSILDLTIPLTDPDARPRRRREHIRLEGDVPNQLSAEDETGSQSGCPFHTRCPRFLGDICADEQPPWQETKTGKRIFCHIPIEELEQAQRPIFDEKGAT
jgi:peptide/nickel transport system ATP-binding protein